MRNNKIVALNICPLAKIVFSNSECVVFGDKRDKLLENYTTAKNIFHFVKEIKAAKLRLMVRRRDNTFSLLLLMSTKPIGV